MSKNMTRKGLALGTASALVFAGLAGTPAFAGGLPDKTFVSLVPSQGTSYTVLTGASKTFSLTSNEATAVAGVGRNLKFLVTDSDSAIEPTGDSVGRSGPSIDQTAGAQYTWVNASNELTIEVNGSTLSAGDQIVFSEDIKDGGDVFVDAGTPVEVLDVDGTASFTVQGNDADIADVAVAENLVGSNATSKVVREARDDDGNYVVDSGSATDTSSEVLILSTGSAEDSTRSVTVEAWVDANQNDEIDATEYASPVRTVTFKKASEITAVVTWTAPVLGDATLKASVKTTPELNGSQMSTDDVSVKFTRQGSSSTLEAKDTVGGSTSWDSVNKEWDALAGLAQTALNTPWNGLTDVVANEKVIAGTYSARPFIGSTALSAAVSAVVSSTQADDVKAVVVATANNDGGENADSGSATDIDVRKGSSVTVTATIYDDSATPKKVGAGVPVTGTLTVASGTIRVNGVAGSSQKLTDANGQVTFVVSTVTARDSDAAVLTIKAQNVDAPGKMAAFDFDWEDPTVKLFDSAIANAADETYRSISEGGSVAFNFRIVDQWAQALSGSYRLRVANTGNTVSTGYVTVTNGAASVTVTDGQIDAGDYIYTSVDVEKDVSGTWTAQELTVNNGGLDIDTLTYTIGVATQTDVVKTDDVAGDYSSDIALEKTAAIDTRVSNAAVAVFDEGDDYATVVGTVENSVTAVPRAGALVTVSGPSDLLFTNGEVLSFGSITLRADSNGDFSVDIYSNKAQEDTVVTITSNGATATEKVTFEVNGTAGAAVMNITAPANVQPGSTFKVTGKLTDEYGNALDTGEPGEPVDAKFALAYTGPGIVFGQLPDETDANGEFSFVVLLGSNDRGTATVTASYDYDGTSTVYAAAAATKTITVGSGAASGAGKVNVGSFNGKLVVYASGLSGKTISWKVGGNWGKAVASSNYSIFNRPTPRAGVTVTVNIYVNGVLTLTKSVVTR